MGAARNLFLGVYGASPFIKILFLPTCYLLILSPFLILLARRYQALPLYKEVVPENFIAPDILPQIFISLVAICLATRTFSGRNSNITNGGPRRIQLIPYWIPVWRHWANIIWSGEGWLKSIRDASITNIFAYSLTGTKHNVILSPTLLEDTLKNKEAFKEADLHTRTIPRNAFLLLRRSKNQYLQLRPDISETLSNEIFRGPALSGILSSALKILSDSLPDLISFNSSIVDQAAWERVADMDLTDGTEEAECDLYALLNEFFCHAIIPPLIGAQLYESYQLLASDLGTINQSFWMLALGFPRWIPIPGLPGASYARKRLLHNLGEYFKEISRPGPLAKPKEPEDDGSVSGSEEETDAETPTPLTALNDLLTQHNVPIQTRAVITLELLLTIVSEAVPLAFWTLVHIYSTSPSTTTKAENGEGDTDSDLPPMTHILQETRKWAEATQPPSIHPAFPAPPQIAFGSPALLSQERSFPYLRSCIQEGRRLYDAKITTLKLEKEIVVTETGIAGAGEQKWNLEKGSYLDVGMSEILINSSSANHLDVQKFKHDRFIHSTPSRNPSTSHISSSVSTLTTPLLLALISGLTQLWTLTPAPKRTMFEKMQLAAAAAAQGGHEESEYKEKKDRERKDEKEASWWIPGTKDGMSVRLPSEDIRVRFRRREGLRRLGWSEVGKGAGVA